MIKNKMCSGHFIVRSKQVQITDIHRFADDTNGCLSVNLQKICYLYQHFLILLLLFSFAPPAEGANRYTSSTPGNWSNTATWSTSCGGAGGASVPGAGDNVTICGGATVTNAANRTIASLTIAGTLNWTSAVRTITVTGNSEEIILQFKQKVVLLYHPAKPRQNARTDSTIRNR